MGPLDPAACSPLHLLLVLLLPGLGLHLLHLDGVGLPSAHVQLVVPHAEVQDPLVDAQAGRVEHEVLQQRTGADSGAPASKPGCTQS